MNTARQQWNLLSARLGVKPKQFAVLLGVLAVAVVGLGFKYAPRGSKQIAWTQAANPTTNIAGNQIQINDTQAIAVSNSGTDSETSMRMIEMNFDRSPTRDPFKAIGAVALAPATTAYAPVAATTKMPGLLPGIMLKAVIRGELAVFGDQTVHVGDAVALSDGTFASVRAIADRSVTVEYGNRIIEVCFGAASQSNVNSTGGVK